MRLVAAWCLSAIFLSGCASQRPVKLVTPAGQNTISEWLTSVKGAVENATVPPPTDVKGKRNLAIAYTEAAVLSHYESVRAAISNGRAATSIAFDILDLGLTTTVPIVNGARGKTILGALATGFKGTQLSIDRNLFYQQTTSAILSAMDTCVLRQRRLLTNRRALAILRGPVARDH